MRPVLSPAARQLWRDQESLQLSRPAAKALVLVGLDPAARAVLGLLDGTRDLAGVIRSGAELGCAPARTRDLLALLQGAGLLVDAADRWPSSYGLLDRDRLAVDVAGLALLHGGHGLPALQRRDRAAVVIVGAGRVGAAIAGLLAAAGIGTVDILDDAAARPQDTAPGGLHLRDVGRRRGVAAREHVQDAAPSTRTGPVACPDLVVLAPAGALDAGDVRALEREGVPHLLAEVRDTVGVVGPLVMPGHSACLRCLDLDRTDRDPDWPVLSAQLAIPTHGPAPCDVVLAAAVAAQAAQQALALLDHGEPASLDGSLELALPDWRWRRRSWAQHPACECGWQSTG